MKTQEKYDNIEIALIRARKLSLENPDDAFYVVLSKGMYYVDTDGFIRNWEELIAVFVDGQRE